MNKTPKAHNRDCVFLGIFRGFELFARETSNRIEVFARYGQGPEEFYSGHVTENDDSTIQYCPVLCEALYRYKGMTQLA